MRIVQIIDSLEAGGAERMAVNYANALAEKIEFSGLIASRKEGLLVNEIEENVEYLFLKKKKKIDFKAIFKLRNFIKKNKVAIIQAHSSSFFLAILVKLTVPKIKIIWHDHYGISQDLSSRKNLSLKLGSLFFKGIVSVNSDLKAWSKSHLWCSNVTYFPNFILDSVLKEGKMLKGEDGKRIICVANLRAQKNHELLIDGAFKIQKKFPDWTFHLVGKDFKDQYSEKLILKVQELHLSNTVFFYGELDNPQELLQKCEIGVLTSLSEGLPLALLEYGLCSLPVVATNVGEISKIIRSEKEGFLIESNNLDQFTNSLAELIQNKDERKEKGKSLKVMVEQHFSKKTILNDYLLWLKSLTTFVK